MRGSPSVGCSYPAYTSVLGGVVSEIPLFTIGQGARRLADLVEELRARGIRFLCDVRSVPISNFAPEFCRDELKAALAESNIVYVSFGDSLGGRPADPAAYASDGRIDYERLVTLEQFVSGLDRIIRGVMDGHRMAIFCSEGRPEQCHRSKAIGTALEARGIRVCHIDVDGTEVDQSTAMNRLAPPPTLINIDYVDPRKVSRRTYR
jgi:uncharacterized protein (DUF488 family)